MCVCVESSIFSVNPEEHRTQGGNYTNILKSECRTRDSCVSLCSYVCECVHSVCLQRPTSCLKTNHSKDSKTIEMQIRHMASFLPKPPKKLGDPISAFGGKLSSDTPHWARMCVKSTLQWHNMDLDCLGNKIMATVLCRWNKLNNICHRTALCLHSFTEWSKNIFLSFVWLQEVDRGMGHLAQTS